MNNKYKQIHFPSISKIKQVDDLLSSALSNQTLWNNPIRLNLARVTFIEVTCLIYILAVLAARKKKGLQTTIKLPESKDVRDFLRAWSFPTAVTETTGISFMNSVSKNDHKYFGENTTIAEEKYAGKILQCYGRWERLLENYLPILSFRHFGSKFDASLAMSEAGRWKRQVVTSVLEKHLTGPHGYFASRIVYEAMMNAVRHPNANIIQTASYIIKPGKDKDCPDGSLNIIWWDDGLSVLDTLKTSLNKKQEISNKVSDKLRTRYQLVLKNEDDTIKDKMIFHSDDVPNLGSPDYFFLLSSIFPGITCDISGKGQCINPDLGIENPSAGFDPIGVDKTQLTTPGMGLYLLANAAVNIYSGSLSFRTNRFNMALSQHTNKDTYVNKPKFDYLVEMKQHSDQFCFLGNMLTVRLPLNI